MENIEYKISEHAKQRYSERVMGRDNVVEVNRYITLNEDKIKTDITKLITYGELIYTGNQAQKDGKNNVIDVYSKDTWVVLVDNRTKVVITLYKIDLGLDDEFNKAYVSKMIEKLNGYKEVYGNVQQQVNEESSTYRQMINDAETQIKEYRSMIKNLEELCSGYKTIIDNNHVKAAQAKKDVDNTINKLIGKKTF